MFSCPDDVRIELGMKMMWDGTIDGFHIVALEEFMVIGGGEFQGRNVFFEPAEGAFVHIAHRRQNRPGIDIGEVAPTRCGAGKFPAHEAQSDESESNISGHFFSVCNRSCLPRLPQSSSSS